MPLLAEAYADARLSTKKLDTDIDRTQKKLERAVGRFQKTLDKVTLRLDTTQAIKRLRDIQISADKVKRRIAETATLNVNVDQAALAADAAAARETVDSIIGEGVDTGEQLQLPFEADIDSAAEAGRDAARAAQESIDVDPPTIQFDPDDQQVQRTIVDVKADLKQLAKTVGKIPLDGDPDQIERILSIVRAKLARLQQDSTSIDFDVNSADDLAEIQALGAAIRKLDRQTASIGVDVLGAERAFAQLGIVNAAKEKVDGDANVNVDVNGSGEAIGKLSAVAAASATATASLSGLDAPAGLANSIGGIAAAAAAIGPTVPGLLGAGVGFLAIGAGALAAVGGIAALGVALNKVALEDLKDQFASVKAELVTTFQPVADLIVQDVAPRFLGAFSNLIQTVAPLAEGLIGPIADSLIAFVDTFSSILTPELIAPFATGIAGFIDSFGKFIPTLAAVTQEIAGPFFDALSGLVDLLFGTAETATPLWTGALSGFADLARNLVGPLNEITQQVVGTFQRIGPAVGNVFGDIGDLIRPFIDGVLGAVELIVDTIDSIGIENLLNIVALVGVILAPANPLIGFVGAFLFLKDAIDIIGPALQALAPLFTIVGQIAKGIFDAVTDAVRSFIGAIDFDQVRGVLEPFLRYIQAGFRLVGNVLRLVAQQAGAFVRGFQDNFNLGALQALFVPTIQLFTSLSNAVESVASSGRGEEFQEQWGGAIANIANAIVNLGLRFQQFLVSVLTNVVKPLGNAAFNIAKAWLGAFRGIVGFLSGPFGDAIFGILKPIAAFVDFQTLGVFDFAASLDAAQQGLDAIDMSQDAVDLDGLQSAFNSGADAAIRWGQSVIDLQNQLASGELTWEEYIARTGLVAPTQEEAAAATDEARTKLDELNASYAAGKIDANEYYKGVAEAAATSLPATAKAFERLQEIVAKGVNLEEGAELARKQIEQASKAAETTATSTAANLRRALGSGGLGSFFTISDEQVGEVEDGARKVFEATQKYLGLGKLSEFIDREAVEVDRALFDLVQNLERKAANIGRLRQLEALGLPNVAAQLATLADQPEVLEEAINQIFQQGVNAFRGFEGQLGSAAERALRELTGLSPAIAAGLGQDFGKQAADQIDKGNLTIQQALDKLTDNIRTKAGNIRRLNQLESLGFGTLAEELATLNDDPKALASALDQLFAGGIGAIRAANGQIESAYGELQRSLEGTGSRISEALGLDEVTKTIEDESVSIGQALDALRQQRFREFYAFGVVRELEQQGFGDLAQRLVEVEDPELFIQWATELANTTYEGRQLLETQIESDIAALGFAQAGWNQYFQEKFGVLPPQVAEQEASEIEQAGTQISNAITDLQTTLNNTLASAFGVPLEATPGVAVDNNVITEGATQAGSLYGKTFASVLADELRIGVSAAITEAFFAKPIAFDPDPQTPLIDTFTNTATRIGETFATVISETLTARVSAVFTSVLPPVALLSGISTSLSLATGLLIGGTLVTTTMTGIADSIRSTVAGLDSITFVAGSAAGERLALGLNLGWSVEVITVITTITNSLSTITTTLGRLAADAGLYGGRMLGAGVADALGSTETRDRIVASAAVAANAARTALTIVGISVGDQFVAGIVAGLDQSQPEVEAAAASLRTALETAATAPVQLTAQVDTQATGLAAVPTGALTVAATAPTSDTVILQQMLVELQAQNAELRAAAARPLIGEYNVTTNREPQSPDQLAADASFAKALLL